MNFNSHAHVERDWEEMTMSLMRYRISTHTLTWSVTVPISSSMRSGGISTHTLTWSVTIISTYRQNRNKRISTHTLTWSVTVQFLLVLLVLRISTHTLTWSVTHLFEFVNQL